MSIKHVQHSDDLLCSPLLSIHYLDHLGKSKNIRRDGRVINPPEDFEVDDDAADITEQNSHQQQQQRAAYPISGTHQADGEEDQTKVEEEDDDMAASWAGQPAIKGSTESMRMALLTFSLIGLQ
jgi:hypothetical protein